MHNASEQGKPSRNDGQGQGNNRYTAPKTEVLKHGGETPLFVDGSVLPDRIAHLPAGFMHHGAGRCSGGPCRPKTRQIITNI